MFTVTLTPAAGKRLIGKAAAQLLAESPAFQSGNIVIIAGTTNGYVVEELFSKMNLENGINKNRFIRGITTPPSVATTDSGRLPDESEFPGDVVIHKGQWLKGKTIFDVVDELAEGDIVVKGANCINTVSGKAGILIGHPRGGTILAAIQAVIGKRAQLLVPVGLEKRIDEDIDYISSLINSPGMKGPRMAVAPGETFTEIDAIGILTGAEATLVAAGGVCGAEGSVWLAISGTDEAVSNAKELLDSIQSEQAFSL